MQFLSTLILGLTAVAFANPMPAEGLDTGILAKRCIPDGGDCTNRYTECCGQGCSIAHDGTGFCA